MAGSQGSADGGLSGSSGELHSSGRQTSFSRFFGRSGQHRNGRPVIRTAHRTRRKSDGLEAVEGKRLITPRQFRISAPSTEAACARITVAIRPTFIIELAEFRRVEAPCFLR